MARTTRRSARATTHPKAEPYRHPKADVLPRPDLGTHRYDSPLSPALEWENLKRALRATCEESVWDRLAGTKSAPFGQGEQRQVAVRVIDDRSNELLVVKKLDEARA